MRLRHLAVTLIIATAACSSPASGNTAEVCEGFATWAKDRTLRTDPDPAAKDFRDMISNTAKYPIARRIEIRRTYFTTQQKAIQPMADRATDENLRKALQGYADGWSQLAADTSPTGPAFAQPDWQPVIDRCPGVLNS